MAKHGLQSSPWFCLNHEDLTDNIDEVDFEELPPLLPRFLVPSLQGKPQDPIVERLESEKSREKAKGSATSGKSLPSELHVNTEDLTRLQLGTRNDQPEFSVWSKLDLDSHMVYSSVLESRTHSSSSRSNSFPGMHCGQLIKCALPLLSSQKEMALYMLQRDISKRTMTTLPRSLV